MLGEIEHLVAQAVEGEEIATDERAARLEDLMAAVAKDALHPLDRVVADAVAIAGDEQRVPERSLEHFRGEAIPAGTFAVRIERRRRADVWASILPRGAAGATPWVRYQALISCAGDAS